MAITAKWGIGAFCGCGTMGRQTLFGHLQAEQPLGVHAHPVGGPADQIDCGKDHNRDHHPLDDRHRRRRLASGIGSRPHLMGGGALSLLMGGERVGRILAEQLLAPPQEERDRRIPEEEKTLF